MNINFCPMHSSACFSDGQEDYEKREVVSIGVRMDGWLNTVELTAGGKLNDLTGYAVLHRGIFEEEEALGQLTYVPEFTDIDIGDSDASFQVDLFLSDSTYEAVLRNVERGRLPKIQITIKYSVKDENAGIKYGNLPDGSLKIWDNENHNYLLIVGYDILFDFVPEPDESQDDENDYPESSSPPTAHQLDKIISEIDRLRANTRSLGSTIGIVFLIWVVVSVLKGIF